MANAIPSSFKYAVLKGPYEAQFAAVQIQQKWVNQATTAAQKIASNKARYDPVSAKTGVPWIVIGIIHFMEGGGNFSTHLHNGDPLSSRTVQVPSGQPATGSPPFTFEDSAADAIGTKLKTNWKPLPATEWGIAAVLWRLVAYNGFGYEPKGRVNAYLWSGTQFYGTPPDTGKFVSDGKYSATAISGQVGAAAILKRSIELGFVDGKTLGTGSGIANIANGGNGCINGGAGGNTTMSQQNPQSIFEAMQVAFGLDGRARAQDRNVELRLNGAADPLILQLDPQKTFEINGVQKDFIGTYTVDEVIFTCGAGLDVKVIAYAPDPNAPPPAFFSQGGTGLTPGTGVAPPAGSINERIFKAAEQSRGFSTRSGPGGGNVACAWVVNRTVLKVAGIAIIGSNPDYVTSVEDALIGGRGQLVEPRTNAQPGDIIIMGRNTKAHIGVYMGNGRTLSNSSSKASFTWEDTFEAFDRRYGPPNCKAYRVTS